MTQNTRVWLIWLAAVTITGVLTYNPIYLAAIFITLLALSKTYGIPCKRYIQSGLLFALLPLAVNLLFVHGGASTLIEIPTKIKVIGLSIPLLLVSGPITLESLAFGLTMALLLLDMLLAFGIFSSIINPDSLLNITPKLLFNSSLLSSIALRFTPVISDDMKSIRDAQRSRGLNLSTGNLAARILKHRALVVPALVSSLERSFNLAESMASRAYTKNRTAYRTEAWRPKHILTLTLVFSATALVMLSKAAGLLDYWPYSSLTPDVSPLPLLALLLLASPAIEKWIR